MPHPPSSFCISVFLNIFLLSWPLFGFWKCWNKKLSSSQFIHFLPPFIIFIFVVIIIFTLAWICSSDQKHHPIRLSPFLSHFFVQIGQLGICSKIRLLSFNVKELLNFGDPDLFYFWINLRTLDWLRTGSQYLLCEHPNIFQIHMNDAGMNYAFTQWIQFSIH